MEGRHCSGLNAATESITHDQVGSCAKLMDKWAKVVKRVAVVSIGHDDQLAPRSPDARPKSSAVATPFDADNPRSLRLRDRLPSRRPSRCPR